MRYSVRLRSKYRYTSPVRFARHALRLLPGESSSQRVESASLRIEPIPYQRGDMLDFFGNRVVQVALEGSHTAFALDMDAQIDVSGPDAIEPDRSPPWEAIRQAAVDSTDPGPLGPAQYLHAGSHTAASDGLIAFARSALQPGRAILAAAFELACRIQNEFDYEPGATAVETAAAAAWKLHKGVCQDFAHVLIAALRSVGLPAAYVSGLLRTRPPPGQARLESADAMHAWVSVWCGPTVGWVDIDPTNGLLVTDNHIRIAVGREYADVAPIDGVIVVSGEQSHGVAVDVIPLA